MKKERLISLLLASLLLLNASAKGIKDKTSQKAISKSSYNNEMNEDNDTRFDIPVSSEDYYDSLRIYFVGDEPIKYHELTTEEKFEEVAIAYGLTDDQLYTICAVFAKEAFYMNKDFNGNTFEQGADYEDAKHVASVALNRLHTKRYVDAYGTNLYNQMINGGYEVYYNGIYKEILRDISLPQCKAIIDVLHSQVPINDRLEFRANLNKYKEQYKGNYIEPVKGGNLYIDSTSDEEMIDYTFQIYNDKQLILK